MCSAFRVSEDAKDAIVSHDFDQILSYQLSATANRKSSHGSRPSTRYTAKDAAMDLKLLEALDACESTLEAAHLNDMAVESVDEGEDMESLVNDITRKIDDFDVDENVSVDEQSTGSSDDEM